MRSNLSSSTACCTVGSSDRGSLMVTVILLEGGKDGNRALKGKSVPLEDADLDSVALSLESV